MATVLLISGWAGGFFGVTIEQPAAKIGPDHLHKIAHPAEVLSAGGTFIANAAACL